MKIQINTGHFMTGSEKTNTHIIELLTEELSEFSSQITRLEVHLSDENGPKEGINDKRCMLEARIIGKRPFAVTNHADSHEQAISGAIDKLKALLETKFGQLKNY